MYRIEWSQNFSKGKKMLKMNHCLPHRWTHSTHTTKVIYNLEQVAGFLKVVLKKLNFMATFHRWGSTVSRLQSNYEEKVYFLPLSRLEKHGTHLIELARMNGWVYRGATKWIWTQEPWPRYPPPQPLLTITP